MAKKVKKEKLDKLDRDNKWSSVPATAYKSEDELVKGVKNKRGKYEEKVAVDMLFEDLIKLSVTDTDKEDKPKSKTN